MFWAPDCTDVGGGTDLPLDRPLSPGPVRLGWCGNPRALEWLGLRDHKGLFRLKSWLSRIADVELSVATDLGTEELDCWFRELDIFVCASRNEGTPLPVIEAMARGLPVLTTNVGVVPELTSPGVVRFEPSHTQFEAQLGLLLAMRSQWALLGSANRTEIARNRSANRSADDFERTVGSFDGAGAQ
ncbi:MAG: glycosyltransferase family 4 protein [Pseudonocardiales bacterium]|nr:glycosyltransferase family 4 protein [Pseudonocardiales bacterium]